MQWNTEANSCGQGISLRTMYCLPPRSIIYATCSNWFRRGKRFDGNGVYGIRNLLEISPEVRVLARDERIRRFVVPVLGPVRLRFEPSFLTKCLANWSLFWHQDNIISVRDQKEVPGFTGWSCKVGVWQVQPPAEILGRMIAVRVHLDDCDADNGPLRVLPGSHLSGWIDEELETWKQTVPEVVVVRAGGVVTMCPLTLHASAPAERVGHRRVIHLEYANENLPGDLEWNNRI